MAEALYRKYRPQVFEDVVGQEPIERTLKNAITQDKVSHAYLFCGPRGTGKTTTARLLAKALLCQAGPTPDPDGTCEDCKLIAEGLHPDVYELDAASRTGVENVREEIISRVQFAPTRGRSKIYIIDEVHMLSVAAFNALLKTLEEPPSHVVFVLCTTDPQKVPETIHSRCQRFDFRRIAPESMVSRLGAICIAEGVEFEGEALDLVAHRAEGGLRNALTSLEQIIAFENGKVTLAGAERLLGSIDSSDMAEIVAYVGKRDIANCFRWTAAYVETGADLAQFVRDMAEHIRNLYVLALVGDDVDLEISETTRHQMISELQWFGPDRLSRLMGVLGDLSSELKTSSNPRLAFEIALTRMVRPDSDLTLESLAERIEALESGYSSVAHVLPGNPLRADNGSKPPAEDFGNIDWSDQPSYQQESSLEQSAASQAPHMQPQGNSHENLQQAPSGAAQQQSDTYERVQPRVQPQTEPRPADYAGSHEQPGAGQTVPAGTSASGTLEVQQPTPDGGRLSMLENPATVQRVWQAALSAVKKQKQAYGVLFMNAKARFDANAATLRVSFPAEAAFAYNAVQKVEVQDALAVALEHAVGAPVAFTYERAGQGGSDAQSASAARAQAQIQSQPQHQAQAQHQAQPSQQFQPQVQAQPAVKAQMAGQTQPKSQAVVQPQPQSQPAVQPQPEAQQAAQRQAVAQPQAQAQPQAEAQQAAQRQAVAQPQAQAQPQPEAQAQAVAQLQPQPQPEVQTQAVAQPQSQPQPQPEAQTYDDMPPYDDVVPYEDLAYEPVPYEDLGISAANDDAQPVSSEPAPAGSSARTSASAPFEPPSPENASQRPAPNGDGVANQPDVEALLQAGFGGGVVFSEVDE